MASDPNNPDLIFINTDQYAAMSGRAPEVVRRERIRNGGPPYFKLGDSKQSPVLYKLADVIAYLAAHRVDPAARRAGGNA